jgi:hypothetical protein
MITSDSDIPLCREILDKHCSLYANGIKTSKLLVSKDVYEEILHEVYLRQPLKIWGLSVNIDESLVNKEYRLEE